MADFKDLGIPIVLPKQGNFEWVASFNPLFKQSNSTDPEYQARIQELYQQLQNQQVQFLPKTPISYNGKTMMSVFSTPFNQSGQSHVQQFLNMAQSPNFITFDIESMGDPVGFTKFGLTEIGAAEFMWRNGNVVPTSNKLNLLINPGREVLGRAHEIFNQLSKDPYAFNRLNEWEKRMIVDMIRYSQIEEKGYDPARIALNGGVVTDFSHNTFAETLFKNDQLLEHKVVAEMNRLLPHIKSGMNLLSSNFALNPIDALHKYKTFVEKNKNTYFLSHNGSQFDLPALQAWAKKLGQNLPNPERHVDFLSVISTVFPNTLELHQALNPNFNGRFDMGSRKLQSFRKTLGLDATAAHSSQADIGLSGLAGVIEKATPVIYNKIQGSKVDVKKGFSYHPTGFTWNNEPIRVGQQLFSIGGFQAYQDGDSSFMLQKDEKGHYRLKTDDFNKTYINSKSFYTVGGLYDLSKNGTTRLALELIDHDKQRKTYIVREGDRAFEQLTDFVQSRFYNWENVSPDLKRQILLAKEKDLARRRYLNLFSLSGAGTGLTTGFEAAKRTFYNAEIYKKRLEGKDARINEKARQLAEMNGTSFEEEKGKLLQQCITHEEMMKQMDFNSLPVKDEKTGRLLYDANGRLITRFNPEEQRHFFLMAPRLLSELDIYKPAIEAIDKAYTPLIEQAMAAGDKKMAFDLRKQRDIAWHLYHQRIQDELMRRGLKEPTEQVELQEFENKRIHFTDYDRGVDTKRLINLESDQTAIQSIYKYINEIKTEDMSPEVLARRQKEKLKKMIDFMSTDGVISDANAFYEIIKRNASVHDTVMQIAAAMRNHENLMETMREQTALTRNKAIQQLKTQPLDLFVKESIQKSRSLLANTLIPKQIPGHRIRFNPTVEEILNDLDQIHPLTGLAPKNRLALEGLLADLMENYSDFHYALSLDRITGVAKISVFRPEDSTSVSEHLAAGQNHPKTLDITLPLINKRGTHVAGRRVLNARTYLDYVNGQFKTYSTSEMIANDYRRNLSQIMGQFKNGNVEEANRKARQILNESIESLSGIQRNLTGNDTFMFNSSLNDLIKQATVNVENAMIKQWLQEGRLTESDFNPSAFKDGKLKDVLTIDDVKFYKGHGIIREIGQWVKNNQDQLGMNLFVSGVKGEHAAHMLLSRLDPRDFTPFGHFTNQGRDNAVQFTNAHPITAKVAEQLMRQPFYTNFNSRVVSPLEDEMNRYWRSLPEHQNTYHSVDVKVGFIDTKTLHERMEALKKTHADELKEMGILREDGTWDEVLFPRVYEQQATMAKELADILRYQGHQILTKGEDFRFAEGLEDGSYVRPGQIIGTEIRDGVRVPVRWERPYDGHLFVQNGEVGVQYTGVPYKFLFEGEKATKSVVPKRLIELLTGDKDIVALLNPNIKKHQDYGTLLAGQSRLLGEYMTDLEDRIASAQNDYLAFKTYLENNRIKNQKKLNRIRAQQNQAKQTWEELKAHKQRILDAIQERNLGLEWDESTRRFIDRTGDLIREKGSLELLPQAMDEVFDIAGIKHESNGIQTGILKMIMSNVEDESKIVDEKGRKILGTYLDENGHPRIAYASEPDGVRYSHREMWAFKEKGLTKTHQLVYQHMLKQGRFEEANNLITALTGLAYHDHQMVDQHNPLNIHHFELLPEIDNSKMGYHRTIFDKAYVNELLSQQGKNARHGYWLQLPETTLENGQVIRPTINLTNKPESRKQIDKIFIPFTNLEGLNGQIYLREIQKNIANIYRRAAEVEAADSIEKRLKAHERLQESIDEYAKRLIYETTSSKGIIGETYSARVGNTFSGKSKIIDPKISQQLDGDYVIISERNARMLGIYNALKNGQDIYALHTRYPTFHLEANQLAKVKMSPYVSDSDIHYTSLAADLTGADSDGDTGHLWIPRDEQGRLIQDIQKEWEKAYSLQQEERQRIWDQHFADAFKKSNPLTLQEITDQPIRNTIPNSEAEVMAKIGKRFIGQASNLGLAMRQLAEEYLKPDDPRRNAVHRFTQALEQVPISSKHLKYVQEGRIPAAEMVEAIRRGNFNQVQYLDRLFYNGEFADNHMMNEALDAMSDIFKMREGGLNDPTLRIGTSYGINPELGVKEVADILHGHTENSQIQTNSLLNMMREGASINIERERTDLHGNTYKVNPYQTLEDKLRQPRDHSLAGVAGELAHDLTGGVHEGIGESVRKAFQRVAENPRLKWGAILGGLALSGLAGYNILKHNEPITPQDLSTDGSYTINQDLQAMSSPSVQELPSADIHITASGKGYDSDQLSQMVYHGMQQSNMNSRAAITIDHRDNTQKLNRIWYRDKVQENTKDAVWGG